MLAARPGSDKYNAAMHYRDKTKVKVVLPHWFDDCFKLFFRLDEKPYTWPDPPVLRPLSTTPVDPGEAKQKEVAKKARLPDDKRDIVATMKLADQGNDAGVMSLVKTQVDVWHGRKILLSSELGMARGRRDAVEISVRRAGGNIVILTEGLDEDARAEEETRKIGEADVYITKYRFGHAYLKVALSFTMHKSSPNYRLIGATHA